jgi:hypothetical protein
VELDHYYELESSNENYQQYKIFSRLDANSNWQHVGWMEFNKTTPPGCGNATPCSDLPEPPIVVLDTQPNGFSNVDVCADLNTAAGFQPVFSQELGNVLPDPCYNAQTQRWQYKFSNGNTVHFNVIIDVCLDNIQSLGFNLIDDYDDFPLNYSCENVMQDMIGHLFYPPKINIGGYFLKSILIRHELEHKLYFENILYGLKNEFQNDMYMDPKNCADFPTTLAAYNYFSSIKTENLLKWWDKAIEVSDKETGLEGFDKFDEWSQKIFWAHERATHLKIYKYIFEKINAARNFYCL